MKKLTFTIVFLLSQIILLAQTKDACLPDGITFTTQEQIDNFQANYPGCTEVEGDVTITDSDISSLAGLDVLTSIGGNLRIGGAISSPWGSWTTLENLSGLDNLTSIGGDLIIGGNTLLTEVTALANLTYIGGNINIGYHVWGYMYNHCFGNPLLISLSGLDNLSYIGGDLCIGGNDSLTELMSLANFNSTAGSVRIGDLVATIEASFTWGNPSLTNLNDMESLTSIGGLLLLAGNNSLTNLEGLENLTSIGGGLGIYGNTSLTSLIELNNLTSIGGSLTVAGNNALTSLTGLENLTSIEGNLAIGSAENLLWSGQWFGTVLNNLTGLENLTSIGGGLAIVLNDSLVSLTGLENLTSIGDGLSIIGNTSLTSLTGLENQTSIGGNLYISNNALTSLTGLENLTSIGGYFTIWNNDALTSLTGLDNIDVGSITDLHLEHNSSLSTCEVQSICDYLRAPNGTVTIENNAPGCNSQAEVEEACINPGFREEETNKIPGFQIYPSPVNDFATLQFRSDQPCHGVIEIFNVTGICVQSQQFKMDNAGQQHLVLDFTAWPTGIYFCRLQTGKKILTKKIVKR